MERVREEFGKTSVWVFGCEDESAAPRERRLQRLLNTARTTHELSSQASLYIPLTNIPTFLPHYLAMDSSSQWHTSAFQATALSTLTLPSRLRPNAEGQRTTLSDLEAAANLAGNRKIASLGLSVADNAALQDALSDQASAQQGRDTRMTNGWHEHEDTQKSDESGENKVDISLFPSAPASLARNARRRPHVFSALQSMSGDWYTPSALQDLNASAADRFSRACTVRYQSAALFPLLDSFPGIYGLSSRGQLKEVAVKAQLSTSTVVADRIRSVLQVVRRVVGVEEREALVDGLEGFCAEYEEGWDGGEDGSSGDDDL
ncbi:hypothetical protein LTS18_002988 [Coniosporium uncinatum]|uniref:Uncharacterized protein n=1 Tax=Coniosporium uncinatum TaxID=93489 RepID=A0ACC3DYA4_9PEZI|nr:hypothetical protein LTS18_002988 [Coniosporium uncinatum]